jgi:phosphatidylserine/phosphatidylglycerophosphate/cardiolipin synthase-like enzyme
MSDSQILVTGKYFSSFGLRSIGPVLQELVSTAETEVHLLAYLLTESAAPLVDLLDAALERGVKVTIVLNNFAGNSPELTKHLQSLNETYGHAKVVTYSQEESGPLHAKVLVSDRKRALVGSANLSWGGMVTNNEIAVLIQDNSAWVLASLIDRLVSQLS